MVTCSACGRANGADASFCSGCGAPLVLSEPLRQERKLVTVLFADLVGFTSRAERLDPEDVERVLGPYHGRLRAELERFGGTVEKFIGDAVMALFGAPVSHEDDPERALRAGLAIRDALAELNATEPGLELQVRIGVATGEALVNLSARPAEGEGMAAGDVVDTAARLQAAAPVNGIIVGEQTFQATSDVIEYRRAEPVQAKGKAEPVPVWEAVQPRARVGIDVVQRRRAPLIGRARDLELVLGRLARVRAERRGQLITLVGAPGIGKSRLVWEVFTRVDQAPELVYWRQGRSLPYGEGVSFWALGEIVKGHAGVFENDSAGEVEAKLRRVVRERASDPGEAEWIEGHLRPLLGLGVEEDARDRRAEAFFAWRRFLLGIAESRPLVLVFEDLHWADDGVLDFVDNLVEWATDVPLLVLATARPELLERRPGWGAKANVSMLSLAPLADEDAARLVAALPRAGRAPGGNTGRPAAARRRQPALR